MSGAAVPEFLSRCPDGLREYWNRPRIAGELVRPAAHDQVAITVPQVQRCFRALHREPTGTGQNHPELHMQLTGEGHSPVTARPQLRTYGALDVRQGQYVGQGIHRNSGRSRKKSGVSRMDYA